MKVTNLKNILRKGFTFVELTTVMFIISMVFWIYKDVFMQKNKEFYLKEEANKIKFLVYEYILNTNIGYVSGANTSCGNLSFDNISVYRLEKCVGEISNRFFSSADSAGCDNTTDAHQKIGLCSYFSSERVIPFDLYIEEESTNTDILYVYIKIKDTTETDKNKMFFEQHMKGYLANAFAPILLDENPDVNWDGASATSTDITTKVSTDPASIYEKDGMFMLTLKKI